jgi:hypothetical protein
MTDHVTRIGIKEIQTLFRPIERLKKSGLMRRAKIFGTLKA